MQTITDPALLAEFEAAPTAEEEFPWLDPATVAGNADKYRDNELKNRMAYREVFDEASGLDQFMVGVGKAPQMLGKGFKQMLGLDDAQDDADIAMMSEQHGLPNLAGQITGDVALTAIPAAGVIKHAPRVAGATSTAGKAGSMLAGETGLTAAYEGAKAPEGDETRLGNAAEAAAWSLALGLPLSMARHAVPDVPVTDAARRLLDDGIDLTPAMAGGVDSKRAKVEKFMSIIPFLSGKVKKLQDKAAQQWQNKTLQKVSPLDSADESVTDFGQKGFQQVQDDFSIAYRDVWGDVRPDNLNTQRFNDGLGRAFQDIDALPEGARKKARSEVVRIAERAQRFMADGDPRHLEKIDDDLRDLAYAGDDQFIKEFYEELRGDLRASMPEEVSDLLTKIDTVYRDFKTVEKAGSYVAAQEAGAQFTPRQLESAVKSRNTPRATTTGKGSMQSEAADATATIAVPMAPRSEISMAGDLGKWGTIAGVVGTGGTALAPLYAGNKMVNEGMRKFLTGTPLSEFRFPARIASMIRQAGVTYIDEVDDPVFKQQLIEEMAPQAEANFPAFDVME